MSKRNCNCGVGLSTGGKRFHSIGCLFFAANRQKAGLPIPGSAVDTNTPGLGPDKVPPPTVLEEAADITTNDRQRYYGHPKYNHGNTADMWSAYLNRKYGFEGPLDARDVCMMMVLLKVSRDANSPKRDNLVDICGYTRNAEQVDEQKGRPQ